MNTVFSMNLNVYSIIIDLLLQKKRKKKKKKVLSKRQKGLYI